MIDPKRARLPIIRQCTLLQLNRSGVYYRPVPQSEANLELMRLIDAQFLETPYYGSRQRHGIYAARDMKWAASGSGGSWRSWACGRSTRSRARPCPIRSIGNIHIFFCDGVDGSQRHRDVPR